MWTSRHLFAIAGKQCIWTSSLSFAVSGKRCVWLPRSKNANRHLPSFAFSLVEAQPQTPKCADGTAARFQEIAEMEMAKASTIYKDTRAPFHFFHSVPHGESSVLQKRVAAIPSHSWAWGIPQQGKTSDRQQTIRQFFACVYTDASLAGFPAECILDSHRPSLLIRPLSSLFLCLLCGHVC